MTAVVIPDALISVCMDAKVNKKVWGLMDFLYNFVYLTNRITITGIASLSDLLLKF